MDGDLIPSDQPLAERTSSRLTRRWSAWDGLLIILLFVAAIVIRTHYIDPAPSFDELWHLGSTKGIGNSLAHFSHDVVIHNAIGLTSMDNPGSIVKVWTTIDGILHPPLFLVALRVWRDVFGDSDLAAHWFSITWSLVAIGFCYAAGRVAISRMMGFLCAAMIVFSQTQVYFAQEIRGYSMMIGLASIAVWLMTKIEIDGATRRRVILLGLLTLPIQLTHYFGIGGALAIGIYGLWRSGKTHRAVFLTSVAAAAVVYCAVWLPFAIRQLDDLATGDTFLKYDEGVWHVVLLAAGVPFRLIAERDYQLELTPVLSGVLFMLPWMLVGRFRVLLPWVLWLTLTVLPLLLLDVLRSTVHLAYPRYFSIATPAVPLLFAGVVWPLNRRLAYLLAFSVAAMGGVYLFSGNKIVLDSDDFSAATRIVEARRSKGDAIATYSGSAPAYYVDVLMLTLSHSRQLFPTTLCLLTKPMSADAVKELNTDVVWLVSGPLDRPVDELIPGGKVTYQEAATRTILVTRVEIMR